MDKKTINMYCKIFRDNLESGGVVEIEEVLGISTDHTNSLVPPKMSHNGTRTLIIRFNGGARDMKTTLAGTEIGERR